jgi:hypothetical protein
MFVRIRDNCFRQRGFWEEYNRQTNEVSVNLLMMTLGSGKKFCEYLSLKT